MIKDEFEFMKKECKPEEVGIRFSFEENIGKGYVHSFSCPNHDYYDALDSFNYLKEGDRIQIKIIKATADNSDFKTASPKLKHKLWQKR